MASLCIDTATENGVVAAARDGEVVTSVSWQSTARHGENLFAHIDAVLSKSRIARDDITLIGVDIGPGKFTSLRVGLGTAKGLALGLDVPIVGVGSLRVLARSAVADSGVARVALMNAYRGDLFAAVYVFDAEEDEELVAPTFGSPDVVLPQLRDQLGDRAVVTCGEGAETHADAVTSIFGAVGASPVVAPSPSALHVEVLQAMRVYGPADLATLEPRYLRPSDAKLPDQPLLIPNET